MADDLYFFLHNFLFMSTKDGPRDLQQVIGFLKRSGSAEMEASLFFYCSQGDVMWETCLFSSSFSGGHKIPLFDAPEQKSLMPHTREPTMCRPDQTRPLSVPMVCGSWWWQTSGIQWKLLSVFASCILLVLLWDFYLSSLLIMWLISLALIFYLLSNLTKSGVNERPRSSIRFMQVESMNRSCN